MVESCFGEYGKSVECKNCAVKHSCMKKNKAILGTFFNMWQIVQQLRENTEKLIRKQREHKAMVRKLGQDINKAKDKEAKALDRYNKTMKADLK